ncbi:MAG TPA: hypothetical protein VEQ41_08535 [Solirubrobacterales bacterium]|nr:hypothetical protein [Solirubrobacterales bacterium]
MVRRGDRRLFEKLVDEVLGGELADSVRQAEVDRSVFREEAVLAAAEIFAEAKEERARRDASWQRAMALRLRSAVGLGAAAIAATGFAPELLEGPLPSPPGAWLDALLFVVGVLLITTLLFGFVLGWRELRGGESESAATRAESLEAARNDFEAALRASILAWLTASVNARIGEIYEPALVYSSRDGLAEVDDPEREITTEAASEVEALIANMPGGSIGVSGPRGAGKTTLIHRVVEGKDARARVAAKVVVDAPVEYDAREFVLHLFARLCEDVLGSRRVDALRGWDRGGLGIRSLASTLLGPAGSGLARPLGPLLLLAGLAGFAAIRNAEGRLEPAQLEPFAIAAIALGAGALLISIPSVDPWAPLRLAARLRPVLRDDRPTATAEIRLRQIWYQQTFSSGWSGSLKFPVGVGLGAEQSTQLAEKQLGFPDVVALYREFLDLLRAHGQVRIGIDELDKMEDERARRFLNEIKVIFRAVNCFYLVSVSEDAMSYFERRGLPFRDVFDSSFDEVTKVGYLSLDASRRLLRRRVVGLPVQFACLSHVLGGGLARDVIRVARHVCDQPAESSLEAVVDAICARQMTGKCEAARVAVRRLRDPSRVMLLSEWLRGLEEAISDRAALLDKCGSFDRDFLLVLGRPPQEEGELLREYREALSIALETIGFAYFVATLRELMSRLRGESETKEAIETSAIERLAQARQAFSVDPSEAWRAISAVREGPLGGDGVPFPLDAALSSGDVEEAAS